MWKGLGTLITLYFGLGNKRKGLPQIFSLFCFMPNPPSRAHVYITLLINSGGGFNKEGGNIGEFGKGAFWGIMCQMGLGILGEYNSKLKLNKKQLVFLSRFLPLD